MALQESASQFGIEDASPVAMVFGHQSIKVGATKFTADCGSVLLKWITLFTEALALPERPPPNKGLSFSQRCHPGPLENKTLWFLRRNTDLRCCRPPSFGLLEQSGAVALDEVFLTVCPGHCDGPPCPHH